MSSLTLLPSVEKEIGEFNLPCLPSSTILHSVEKSVVTRFAQKKGRCPKKADPMPYRAWRRRGAAVYPASPPASALLQKWAGLIPRPDISGAVERPDSCLARQLSRHIIVRFTQTDVSPYSCMVYGQWFADYDPYNCIVYADSCLAI